MYNSCSPGQKFRRNVAPEAAKTAEYAQSTY